MYCSDAKTCQKHKPPLILDRCGVWYTLYWLHLFVVTLVFGDVQVKCRKIDLFMSALVCAHEIIDVSRKKIFLFGVSLRVKC